MAKRNNKAPSSRDIKKMLYSEKKYKKMRGKPGETGLMVIVEDDNIELALKRLKNKIKEDGLFETVKENTKYEKPSVKNRRKNQKIKCKLKWDKILKERLEQLESAVNNS